MPRPNVTSLRACLALLRAPLSTLLLLACGGRAEDPVIMLGGSGSSVPFLSECEEQCAAGLECLEGVCTRACTTDTQCQALRADAECLDGPSIGTRDTGVCAVPCGSDEGCRYLGAGSFCNNFFCVAGSIETLPESFDSLDVRVIQQAPPSPAPGPCNPVEYASRIQVNLRRNMLSRSDCRLLPNVGEYQLDTSRTALDEAGRAQVLNAYSRLQLGADTQCTPGAEAFTLDVAPPNGVDLLFADVEHSACPLPQLQRSSFVAGLNELFATLERVEGIDRETR